MSSAQRAEEWEIYDVEVPEEKQLSFFNDPIKRYLSFGIPGIGKALLVATNKCRHSFHLNI